MDKVDTSTFVKAPIDEDDPIYGWNAVDREHMPEYAEVQLLVWPADTVTSGGIHLPGAEGCAQMGVGWIVRTFWFHKDDMPFGPGDSVQLPDHVIGGGVVLSRYQDGNPKHVMVRARDVYFVYPAGDADDGRTT